MLSEFRDKMPAHKGFPMNPRGGVPIVLSQDIFLLLNMWSCVGYECHPFRCGILCGYYPVRHRINGSCRMSLPRISHSRSSSFQRQAVPGTQELSEDSLPQVLRTALWARVQPHGVPPRSGVRYELSAHPSRAQEEADMVLSIPPASSSVLPWLVWV